MKNRFETALAELKFTPMRVWSNGELVTAEYAHLEYDFFMGDADDSATFDTMLRKVGTIFDVGNSKAILANFSGGTLDNGKMTCSLTFKKWVPPIVDPV